MPSKVQAKPNAKQAKKYPKKNPAGKHVSSDAKEKRLFRSLCSQIDGGHFRNALKTCDAILHVKQQDTDASRTKLFLLLQMEQYEGALQLLLSNGQMSSYDFEKAYALYGLRKEEEAMTEVIAIGKGTTTGPIPRGVSLLEAQLNYRQHDYQEAFDKYSALIDSCPLNSDEHADLSTNLDACQSHIDFLDHGYLHALDEMPSNVANSLEETLPPVPHAASLVASSARSPPAPIAHDKPVVKKKKRLSRVPKGVTPGVSPAPDPERWVKKSERSNYGTHGRRKKQSGGATQGLSAEPVSGQGGKGGKAKRR